MAAALTPESLSWFLFGGAVFFLMGLALHAPQSRAGQARESARGLLWAYRLGGAAFSGLGLVMAAAALRFPRLLLSHFHPAAMTPLGRGVAGLFLLLAGMAMSTLVATAEPSRDLGHRVSFWSGWLLVMTFLGFGVFLLSRPG